MLLLALAPAWASFRTDIAGLINDSRGAQGRSALTSSTSMNSVAQAWAEQLARAGSLSHNPNYSSQIPGGWAAAAENVAYHSNPTAAAMHQQLMDSSGHRANILGNFTHLGVGYATDSSGGGWLVEVFARYPGGLVEGSPPAPAPTTSAPAPAADPTDDGTGSAGTLSSGSTGPAVLELQQNLETLGYQVQADGNFGPQTKEAVEQFQADSNLTVDGQVGPQTSQAISAAVAAATAPTPTPTPTPSAPATPLLPTDPVSDDFVQVTPPDNVPTGATATVESTELVPTPVLVGTLAVSTAAMGGLLVLRRRILLGL